MKFLSMRLTVICLAALCCVGAKPAAVPSPAALLAEQTRAVENEIAALALRRVDLPADRLPGLELQIDLRILSRWMLDQAARAAPYSDLQVCSYIRWTELASATALVDEWLGKTRPNLVKTQSAAMDELHKLTFTLGQLTSVAQMDETCQKLGSLLASIGGEDGRMVPRVMRPAVLERSAQPATRPSPGASPPQAGRPLTQLAAETRQVAVSIPLRKQLIALADRATLLSRFAEQKQEADVLYRTLDEAMALARGLHSNTAVSTERREQLESRLAEALVLLADSRMRSAGRARFESLAAYRQIIARVENLNLSPEAMAQLGPAFLYAEENADDAPKVLGSVERFVELSMKFNGPSSGELPAELNEAVQRLREQFADRQGDFVAAVEGLTQGGALASTPADLEAAVNEMARAVQLIEQIRSLPALHAALPGASPKSSAALQKRLAAVVSAATAPGATEERHAAEKSLAEIQALASAAMNLAAQQAVPVSQPVQQFYTGGALNAFDAKCAAVLGELLGQWTAAQNVDPKKMSRLTAAVTLREALAGAGDVEDAIHKSAALSRWVDWAISSQQLQKVLSPNRDALAGAFVGFLKDQDDAIERWHRARARYAPLTDWLRRQSAYADACAAFPSGLAGEAAKLATPLDQQPFAEQRWVSLVLGVWSRGERRSDFATADAAAAMLAERLKATADERR